jgi:beta-lactamase regulating signal transducer with metallopeptidase domain
MSGEIMSGLLRANLAASAAMIVVLALRTPVARRLGARAAYALWSSVPLAAVACLIPARMVVLHRAVAAAADAAPAMASAAFGHATAGHADPPVGAIATAAWALGAVLWAAALAWRQHRFSRALGPLRREADVYRAQAAGLGPVLLGALRPRIVLPADFEARFTPGEQVVVLAHERAHQRAGDHLVNAAVAVFQCVCWFNPLTHLAAFHLRVDQELACDAEVMARHPRARKAYAEAMLKTQLVPFAAPLGCQWPATGPSRLKRRIAMLKAVAPNLPRRIAGLVLATGFSASASVAAWAAQPPRVQTVVAVYASEAALPPASDAVSPAPRPASHALPRGARRLGVALVGAIVEGAPSKAGRLIDDGADINHQTEGDGTPLVEAARIDDMVTARRLIATGADVNRAAPGDGNPLITAVARGHMGIAALLLDHGADVNGFVLGDETPLIAAARSQASGMVRFLVERGADVNLAVPTGNRPGETRSPLSVTRDPAIADYLRSHGARG